MKKADIDAISAFSQGFAKRLRDWSEDHGIRQTQIADEMGRTQAWVSERLRGLRAVDTDLIAAIARMTDTTPRDLAQHILDDMGGATVTRIPTRPGPTSGPNTAARVRKTAARKNKKPDA